jgi:hypothetical protein
MFHAAPPARSLARSLAPLCGGGGGGIVLARACIGARGCVAQIFDEKSRVPDYTDTTVRRRPELPAPGVPARRAEHPYRAPTAYPCPCARGPTVPSVSARRPHPCDAAAPRAQPPRLLPHDCPQRLRRNSVQCLR